MLIFTILGSREFLRELNNAFIRSSDRPTVPKMMQAYRIVARRQHAIVQAAGAKSLFEANAFQNLCYVAKVAADTVR